MSNQSIGFFVFVFDIFRLIISVGYPIWRSYKVVEAKKFDNELVQWLTYWVLFAMISKLEDYLQAATACLCCEWSRDSLALFAY